MKHIDREVVQARALDQEPVFIGAVAHAMAVKQRPAVERGGLIQFAGLCQPRETRRRL